MYDKLYENIRGKVKKVKSILVYVKSDVAGTGKYDGYKLNHPSFVPR
jgi:hypothetical protein